MKTNWFSRLLGQGDKSSSADIAKQRLTVLVASNDNQLRNTLTQERINKMKIELLEVVGRYLSTVQLDDIIINHRKEDTMDVLEMSINLPEQK